VPHLSRFLVALRESDPEVPDPVPPPPGPDALGDVPGLVRRLGVAPDPGPVPGATGGTAAACRRLAAFVAGDLDRYAIGRNDPGRTIRSGLSPYLHFGQISPLTVALAVQAESRRAPDAVAAYLEELVVRRELSMNFVHRTPGYDRYDGLPEWARRTLATHAHDPRPALYDLAGLEAADTHDPCWNAAQTELRVTGMMHGYMRMYWGKKILEWSPAPDAAFDRALTLNNRYHIDGRDANGFAGVAWCFGTHDRPWSERPVFGKVRYMTEGGLRRKFDMDSYIARCRNMARHGA
jgi:deoxyribodipyrimidine photo-lyase